MLKLVPTEWRIWFERNEHLLPTEREEIELMVSLLRWHLGGPEFDLDRLTLAEAEHGREFSLARTLMHSVRGELHQSERLKTEAELATWTNALIQDTPVPEEFWPARVMDLDRTACPELTILNDMVFSSQEVFLSLIQPIMEAKPRHVLPLISATERQQACVHVLPGLEETENAFIRCGDVK